MARVSRLDLRVIVALVEREVLADLLQDGGLLGQHLVLLVEEWRRHIRLVQHSLQRARPTVDIGADTLLHLNIVDKVVDITLLLFAIC